MRRPALVFFALPLLAPLAATAAPRPGKPPVPRLALELAARADGELVEAEGTREKAELLTFDSGLADGLLVAQLEEEVRVAGWPVAPGERADVVLTRRDVYAPDAVIWEVGANGMRRLPRSRLAFFWGEAEGDPTTRVSVSVDPVSRELRALATSPSGDHELRAAPESWGAGRGTHLLGRPNLALDAKTAREVETSYSCGQDELPPTFDAKSAFASAQGGDAAPAGGPQPIAAEAGISSLHTVRVLTDTDNELMSAKFGNNTTAATNYLANLFAGMNTMYERDLLIRLVQGTTFLRVSTTQDPFNAGTSTYDGLMEYTAWGSANLSSYFAAGPNRHGLAMMLSGKHPSANSAAGIAWVNTLCSLGNGYSYTQVFKFAQDTSANDVRIVGHELGHNFGSPHSHCYSPPIDSCYSGEGGCYAGATSCPAPATYNGVPNVTGTIMSYCHLSSCGSANVFHPRTVDLLDDIILARVGTCVVPLVTGPPPPTITRIVNNSGPTSGGNTVTLYGTGFESTNPDSDVTVRFGGTAATNVNVTSSTQMTVTVPARSTGAVTVSVTNPDNQAASLPNGYFYAPAAAASNFYTVTPCRVLDTRNPAGPLGGPALGAGASRVFTFAGACGIPATARSVSVNVTVTGPGAAGHFQGFPGNAFPLGTTLLAFRPGQTRAGSATLMLATDNTGRLGFFNGSGATAHLIVDVNGYYQ